VCALRPDVPPGPLAGESMETPWDPPLAVAMRHHRVRIEEELVLDTLLHDLTTEYGDPRPQGLGGLPDLLCGESRQ
jgi:Protein of unknown function C-terminus (DUF2399)